MNESKYTLFLFINICCIRISGCDFRLKTIEKSTVSILGFFYKEKHARHFSICVTGLYLPHLTIFFQIKNDKKIKSIFLPLGNIPNAFCIIRCYHFP